MPPPSMCAFGVQFAWKVFNIGTAIISISQHLALYCIGRTDWTDKCSFLVQVFTENIPCVDDIVERAQILLTQVHWDRNAKTSFYTYFAFLHYSRLAPLHSAFSRKKGFFFKLKKNQKSQNFFPHLSWL
jgi:hypothetical protein